MSSIIDLEAFCILIDHIVIETLKIGRSISPTARQNVFNVSTTYSRI